MIPKHHYKLISEQSEQDRQILTKMLAKLVEIQDQLGLTDGYRIIINQGNYGGQEVPHLHIHILGGEKLKNF